MAYAALEGVGDADLGSWESWNPDGQVYHLKRRLTPTEQEPIGDAMDVRGTFVGEMRRKAVLPHVPPVARSWRE